MPVTIERNGYGWVSSEVSRELIRLVFPNYPELNAYHPLPQWVKEKLAVNHGS